MQTSADFALLLLLFVLAMSVFKAKSTFTPTNCGNVTILTAAKGFIHTPNFPKAFPLPIRCRWVIDKTAFEPQLGDTGNATQIYIYLTQLFVTSGLNITEYRVYDEESNTAYTENVHLDLSTTDVISNGTLYVHTVNYSFMVIDFVLDMLEGNHLRVMDNLMDVYGFNITYEISKTARGDNDTCTVSECSFLGHCYASADFSTYNCSCFDGYYGKDCSNGTLCHQKENFCANGGTCRYAGAIVHCLCTDEFTGPKCDIPIPNSTALGLLLSSSRGIQCEFDEKTHQKQPPCSNCRDMIQISDVQDRAHYFLDIRLESRQSFPVENASRLIRREIERKFIDLKLNSKPLTLLNSSIFANMTRIERYHFYANSSAELIIRDSVDSVFKNYSRNNEFHLRKKPSLLLLKVSTNVYDKDSANYNYVHENEEFILSCVAQGSPSISFQWYKDNVPINVTLAVRGKWLEVVPDEDDIYRSLLVVERAAKYDTGTYTCQVKDWGLQQCNSTNVVIRPMPHVQMKPMNIVASRGDNVRILCFSKNDFVGNNERVGYTWMQNGELIKMNVPHLYYEDLYLGGSVLFVNNVQKSEIFGCNRGKVTTSIRVDILDKEQTPYCRKEDSWPITGAGITALQECPDHYSNDVASRLCLMVDAKKAEWDEPDFSQCISDSFLGITENFRRMTLGYQNDTVTITNTLNAVHQWLTIQQRAKLLHGEGESIVKFLQIVCNFSIKTKKWLDFRSASIYFYKIVDVILQNPTSILNREEVFKLSALIEKWTSLLKSINRDLFNTTFSSFEYHLQLPFGQSVALHPNISIKVDGSTHPKESAQVTIMMYKNLSIKLLSNYGLIESKTGEQIYELSSPVVHVLMSNSPNSENTNSSWFVIDVKFKLPFRRSVCCGVVSSFGQSWNLDMCVRQSVSAKEIQCSCNHSGMFALFTSDLRMLDSDVYRKYHLVVMVGCVFCFFLCTITLCVLLIRWLTIRSCLMYLKIQICASTAAAMLLFFYGSCDPSSDTFAYILSGLQMFLFISVSSHISILIVMYIDVISLKNIPNIKVSAISVMTVPPMLLIVFTPFSRQITKEGELNNWWLCKKTLLFYIHIMLGLFVLLLFIFLYYSVMKKLLFLWRCTKVERRVIVQRISFLQYTLVIFASTAVMVISSTVYVNFKSFTSQCVFGSSCALLGFVIFICYFPQNEISFCFRILFPNLKHRDTKYSPELQVCASQFAMVKTNEISETESSSHSSQSFEKSGNIDFQVENGQNSSSEEKKFENHRDLNSIPEIDDEPSAEQRQEEQSEPVLHESSVPPDKEVKLEPDILWPVTKNNYISTSGCPEGAECCSPLRAKRPEMLTTRVCVELGVLKNGDSASMCLPDGSPSTVVICSVDVEPCPGHIVELNEVKFTTNAIGSLCSESVAQKVAEPIVGATTLETKADKTDVLDRISQDLDYLLNRSPSPPTKARRARASVGSPKIPRNSVNKSAKSKL